MKRATRKVKHYCPDCSIELNKDGQEKIGCLCPGYWIKDTIFGWMFHIDMDVDVLLGEVHDIGIMPEYVEGEDIAYKI